MAQTRTITFPDGDYPVRLNTAYVAYEDALDDERRGKTEILLATEDPASEVLKGEYLDLKAEAEDDARSKDRVVTLSALGRSKWRPLKKAHPPRVEDDGADPDTAKSDRRLGVNLDSVEDDLVHHSIAAPEKVSCARDTPEGTVCSGDIRCTRRAAFDDWADAWSEGEWQTLVRSAWSLVNVASIDPKSLPSSPTRTDDAS